VGQVDSPRNTISLIIRGEDLTLDPAVLVHMVSEGARLVRVIKQVQRPYPLWNSLVLTNKLQGSIGVPNRREVFGDLRLRRRDHRLDIIIRKRRALLMITISVIEISSGETSNNLGRPNSLVCKASQSTGAFEMAAQVVHHVPSTR